MRPAGSRRSRIRSPTDSASRGRVSRFARFASAGSRFQTIVSSVSSSSNAEGFSASSRFRILHRGQPLDGGGEAAAVAVVGGERTALLVERLEDGQPDGCAFITDGAEHPTVAPIGPCTMPMELQPLTSDQAVFIDARDARHPTAGSTGTR